MSAAQRNLTLAYSLEYLETSLLFYMNTLEFSITSLKTVRTKYTYICRTVDLQHAQFFLLLDKEIQKYLEVLQVTTNERLEELANTVEQSSDKCCNATTGSFHNPAHNCSHIVDIHPNATSGEGHIIITNSHIVEALGIQQVCVCSDKPMHVHTLASNISHNTEGSSWHEVHTVFTGDYWLQSSTGYAVRVYCDMDRVCGCDEGRRGEGGGWMRVADIDMNLQKSCPSGFRKITSSGKVMCGGQSSRCISTSFSSHGVEYSRVCGRIIAYQFGRTNGLRRYHRNQASIESYFLDGIVLTYGSPRSHIWSFVAGHDQYTTAPEGCPCNTGFTGSVPPYIQDDYFL